MSETCLAMSERVKPTFIDADRAREKLDTVTSDLSKTAEAIIKKNRMRCLEDWLVLQKRDEVSLEQKERALTQIVGDIFMEQQTFQNSVIFALERQFQEQFLQYLCTEIQDTFAVSDKNGLEIINFAEELCEFYGNFLRDKVEQFSLVVTRSNERDAAELAMTRFLNLKKLRRQNSERAEETERVADRGPIALVAGTNERVEIALEELKDVDSVSVSEAKKILQRVIRSVFETQIDFENDFISELGQKLQTILLEDVREKMSGLSNGEKAGLERLLEKLSAHFGELLATITRRLRHIILASNPGDAVRKELDEFVQEWKGAVRNLDEAGTSTAVTSEERGLLWLRGSRAGILSVFIPNKNRR